MSISKTRKSATAAAKSGRVTAIAEAAAKLSRKPAAPTTPAPTTMITVPPVSLDDARAKVAAAKKKKEAPLVAQSVVDTFLRAEGGARMAAVDVFRACLHGKVTPSQFGERADAKVRASEFNSAWAVRRYFGADAAGKMIEHAVAEKTGDVRAAVLRVLRAAKKLGKELSGSKLKGAALKKATEKAAAKAREAATVPAPAQREPHHNASKVADLPTFAAVAMAALADMLERFGKVDIPARMLRKATDAKDAIEAAIDAVAALKSKGE